ncbi:hypothetical protein [Salinimicrobium sediminilitoris]|uniref:hypothetical protein n=1 Tax=Salinimicrobium sediminilitoris TaxID=2876715 RepID=UPI001E3E89DC|nr:hypothetical protein [Salinimicrobium sediminilitoris]MCC8359736.1 hypothetical protein [Salinimicrobium sediminilitoris]
MKDSKEQVVARTRLNEFGIGKLSFIPEPHEKYEGLVLTGEKEIPVGFGKKVDQTGVIISGSQRKNQLNILVKTNLETMPQVHSRPYVLRIQGRNLSGTFIIDFEEEKTIPLMVDLSVLDAGINVVTLFNEEQRPVAERLFFNYNGLPIAKAAKLSHKEVNDSLQLKLSFGDKRDRAMSISVLPTNSVSYSRNHNIVSHNLLQPYIRGAVENGGWYFEDITEAKKNELDNLLITQGWSSYDWQNIFNFDKNLQYNFEDHISLKVHVSKKDQKRKNLKYMIHASDINPLQVIDLPEGTPEFFFDGYLPTKDEQMIISRMQPDGDLLPAQVSIQFFPNSIPDFRPQVAALTPKFIKFNKQNTSLVPAFADVEQDAEELDEVLLTATIDKVTERERKLNQHSWGRVSVIREQDIRGYGTLGDYLRSKGVFVKEVGGTFTATSTGAGGGGIFTTGYGNDEGTPDDGANTGPQAPEDPMKFMAFYLDDNYMPDTSMFYGYSLTNVDRVEINKTGMGNGFIGARGSVKVYTNFKLRMGQALKRNRIQQLDVPLGYSEGKTFYTPTYENRHDKFFEEYGVIDWKPFVRTEDSDEISVVVEKPEVDFQMVIEGITADGDLIYDVQTVSVEE